MNIHQKKIPGLLLGWFKKNRRDLPWRKSKTPYKVWVSEIMLQQTRVDTVVDYYKKYLKKFPSISSLASAPVEDVLKTWEGLGYYSRARNLHKAAVLIVNKYNRRFPNEYGRIRELPGIGEYTAGAIASIAFNQPYPAVDGNVLRVISRIFGLKKDISDNRVKKEIQGVVAELIPVSAASDFCESLMELGALICLPESPSCEVCPVKRECAANKTGRQNEIPVKKKKGKQKIIRIDVAFIKTRKGVLMRKRSSKGLLAGLWELPNVQSRSKSEFVRKIKKESGLTLLPGGTVMRAEHHFTHLVWKMNVIVCGMKESGNKCPRDYKWINKRNHKSIAVPHAFKKVLDKLT